MGLVEGIPGEGFDQVEDFHGQPLVESLGGSAGNEVFALLGHQRGDFLAHRLAHDVGCAQGVAGELLQYQQHLVLVDDDAVGLVQQVLETGMGVGDPCPPVLGVDEPVYVFHRPRSVQGDHRGYVIQTGRLQFLDVALHTGAFQLEHVGGVAGGQQLKGILVVQRQPLQVYFNADTLAHQLHGLVQDGEAGQAQEVHFQQSQVCHRVHAELGHHHRTGFLAPYRSLQRHSLRQRLIGDEHAGGVGADVVYDALQPLGPVHQLPHGIVAVNGALELGADPQGVLQVAGLEGHHPGDAVDVAVAHAQGPAHVAQGRLGPQGAKGNYLGHPVAAVLVYDVVQHLVPPVVLEVHVDVGHFLAFHIKEALEDQAVLQGVNVGDAQAVEDDAGRRAAPHAKQDVALTHELDDVPHHQEVVGELGVANDVQLVAQTLDGLGRGVWVALPEPGLADLRQVLVGVHAVRGLVAGQVGLAEVQRHVAHIGNQSRIRQGGGANIGGQPAEKLLHFLRTLYIVGIILHPQALFVVHRGIGLDADVNVLQAGLVLVDVMSVVGRHQWELQVVAQP